ncbi:MAG: efflux RND transporter periplasmic adaptor subunit [Micavibrio sp.]
MAPPSWAQQARSGGAMPVIVAEVFMDEFIDKVEALGTLRANETVTLAAKVTDTVRDIHFEDGQVVAKGDVLVEMTSREEAALLEQQKALVSEAHKQLQRTRELAKGGAASASLLDQRQREYTGARAGMEALQSRLEDRIITAPFDGVVGLRNISAGALLQPGTEITTLDDIHIMKLDFAVPSIFLPALKQGLKITARAAGFAELFEGEVSAIDSQIDPVTRAVTVRALIPNPQGILKPGLLMTVELQKDPRRAAGIPETAIVPEARKHFVFVVDESGEIPVLEKREIIIGVRVPGEVEVIRGLRQGEKIVTQGLMTARAGNPVSISAVQARGETAGQVLKRLRADNADAQGAQ